MKFKIWTLCLLSVLILGGCSKDEGVTEDPVINLGQSETVNLGFEGGEFTIEVEANFPIVVSLSGESAKWINQVTDGTRTVEKSALKFKALVNSDTKERTGEIVLTDDAGTVSVKVFVVQAGAADDEVIPDDEVPAVVQSQSFFIVNEDWFGHENGTVNRLWFDGHITYRAYRKANPGAELGVTTQYAMNYGGNIYFMSKQGQRFVVADAETLEKKASFKYIGNENGGDGRACVGVNSNTVYVGTNSHIWIFDIPSLSFKGHVEGIDGGDDLYEGQVGDMIRIGDRVFAVMQGRGVLVINTRTHRIEKVIEPTTTGGFCQSKNGWLWIAGNPLVAYDPYTLELKKSLTLAEGDWGGGASWGAWHTCSLFAPVKENSVYWKGHDASKWSSVSGKGIFKYDIDNDQVLPLFGFSSYGEVRIEPLTGYITSVGGSMYNDAGKLRKKFTILGGTPNDDGTVDNENTDYPWWFATLPMFEDVNRPAILTNQIILAPSEERKICLSDMVIDHDNISKSILKEIVFNANDLIQSEVKQDTLYLKAGAKKGRTDFVFKANSNGFPTEKTIRVDIR